MTGGMQSQRVVIFIYMYGFVLPKPDGALSLHETGTGTARSHSCRDIRDDGDINAFGLGNRGFHF